MEHVFTSSLKFLSLAYLSFALRSNVGCFIMGPLILGPLFSALAVPAVDMVWIATFAASATGCVMYSLAFVCSFAILLLCLISFCVLFLLCLCKTAFLSSWLAENAYFWVFLIYHALVCLYETFYSWHHVAYLALVKMTLMYNCKYIYCYV